MNNLVDLLNFTLMTLIKTNGVKLKLLLQLLKMGYYEIKDILFKQY